MSSEKSFIRFLIAVLFAAAMLVAAVFPCLVASRITASANTPDNNYYFRKVEVSLDVRKDKTIAVTEELQVGFYQSGVNTGIIRDIQRFSRTTRIINGKSEQGALYVAGLSDVSVKIDGAPARVTREYYDGGNFYSVKMQKQDGSYFAATDSKDLSTFHTFELSYVYDMSRDKASGYDDFTFDVLGYAMARTQMFVAQINFPEPIDSGSVSVRTNEKQPFLPREEIGERVYIGEDFVHISAFPQAAKKGYTLQVLLPDGYFEGTGGTTFFWYYIPFAVAAFLAIAGGLAVFFVFRTRKPVEPVEFYPPKNVNIMRFSAIWHGGARERDVPALILDWAAKGYLEIERDGRKDVLLHWKKDLAGGATPEEKKYFRALFSDGSVFSTKEMRKSSSSKTTARQKALYKAVRELKTDGDHPSPLFRKLRLGYVLLCLLSLVPLFCTFGYYAILTREIVLIILAVFPLAGTCVGYLQQYSYTTPLMYVFPVAFMALPVGAIFVASYYINMAAFDYIGLFLISLIWWAAAFVLTFFMKRRSDEVTGNYGKIRGFRKFLLTAELDRIQLLFDENPEYFSDILPYCYIMNITRKVEKRFRPLRYAVPAWAAAGTSVASLTHSISHAMGSAGGGGSGGGGGGGSGGSSGGGGGGGGSRGC